jgi:hypothetical protein
LAKRYIGSFPNPGCKGPVREIWYPDTPEGHAQAEAFAQRENVPGRAVYDAINLFRDDAKVRCKETVEFLEKIVVDIDLKDIEESKEEVVRTTLALPYPPSELCDSGHGFHGKLQLKELVPVSDTVEADRVRRLRTRVIAALGGDPSIDHDAALLRRVGTTNSKDPDHPVVCSVVAASGATYDPGDIEDLLDECCAEPLFTLKAKPAERTAGERPGPVDVEAALADMTFQGGEAGINATYKRVMPAELLKGMSLVSAVDWFADEVMKNAARDGQTGWTREAEVARVTKSLTSTVTWLQKEKKWDETGELPPFLTGKLEEDWIGIVARGGRPQVTRNRGGWYVRDMARKPDGKNGHAAESESGGEGTASGKAENSSSKTALPRIRPVPFTAFDFTALEMRQWLYGRHYMRGIASATISPGGGGKTSLELLEAILMATTRPLLGEQPTERLRVWYHNGEDGTAELNRRIAAICIKYGIDPHELEGWLFVTSGLEMPIKIASGTHEAKLDKVVAKLIVDGIRQDQIDVLTLDPLITLHSLSEAGNHMMDPVIRTFSGIANELGCSIELAHHTRKKGVGQDEYSTADARGASAIIDAVRSARIINSLSDKDAKLLGLEDEIERMSYLRLDRGKANMTKRGGTSYYRFVGIELPNGVDGGPGDDVGTLERVMPPDTGIELTENDIAVLVAECANSDQYQEPRGDNVWFGRTVADHFDLNPDIGIDRIKVDGIIQDLLNRKAIRREDRKPRDPKNRHKRKLYVPY